MGGEAQLFHALGEVGSHLPVAVDDEHVLGLGGLDVSDPRQQVIPVGMGGKALKVHDLGVNGDLLAEELHTSDALQQGAAQGALPLIAHEHDGALRLPEVVLQVVTDTARVAHTGGGDDDLGDTVLVQPLGFLHRLRHAEVGEVEHVGAVLHQGQGVGVQIAVQIAGENGGGTAGQRRVDVNREIRIGLHQLLILDLPDEVQQFLGAAYGEGGNHHVAALGHGVIDDFRQILGVAPHLRVVAVAVGGLHDDVVRAPEVAGVPDDGLIHIAQVAGEDQLFGDAVFRGGDGDAGAAQQMPCVGKADADALAQFHILAVFAGGDVLLHIFRVLNGIQRLHLGGAGTGCLAVLPLGVGLLNVGGVQQHDIHEVSRHTGGEDAAPEALLHQHGHPAGMVDMGVGNEHEVDTAGMEGQGFVVHLVTPLLQAAVDQDVFAVDLQTVTAAGHALVSAVKAQLHNGPPSFFVRVFRVVLLLRSS